MNLYKLFDLKKNATVEDIKSSFREKAKKLHPDHGGDSEEFRKLQEAYQILIDPIKRKEYDMSGYMGIDPSILDNEAYSFIRSKINEWLRSREAAFNNNILKLILDFCEIQKQYNEKRIIGLNHDKKFLNLAKKKIRKKKQLEKDVIFNIFNEFENEINTTINDCMKALRIIDRVIEILNHYEFNIEEIIKK